MAIIASREPEGASPGAMYSPPSVIRQVRRTSSIAAGTSSVVTPSSQEQYISWREDPRSVPPRIGQNGAIVLHAGTVIDAATMLLRLPFSRNPTSYSGSLESNIPEAVIPGAADVSLQHLGAKGETFDLQVLFDNAWLHNLETPAHLALEALRHIIRSGWEYRAFWYPGSDANVIPVAIQSINYTAENFTPHAIPDGHPNRPMFKGNPFTPGGVLDNAVELPPDAPQRVTATFKLRREVRSEALVSPFKTDRPVEKPTGGRGKRKGENTATTSNFFPFFTWSAGTIPGVGVLPTVVMARGAILGTKTGQRVAASLTDVALRLQQARAERDPFTHEVELLSQAALEEQVAGQEFLSTPSSTLRDAISEAQNEVEQQVLFINALERAEADRRAREAMYAEAEAENRLQLELGRRRQAGGARREGSHQQSGGDARTERRYSEAGYEQSPRQTVAISGGNESTDAAAAAFSMEAE